MVCFIITWIIQINILIIIFTATSSDAFSDFHTFVLISEIFIIPLIQTSIPFFKIRNSCLLFFREEMSYVS